MSYYQGDRYMGDFYQGDPGLFSFLGGLAKKAVGFIPGVGPVVSSALEKLPLGRSSVVKSAMGAAGGAIEAVKRGVAKYPVLSAAGAAGAVGAAAAALGERAMMGGARGARGRVLRKCGQVLRSGKIGKCRRHMNVTNSRALRRALRRAHGFEKLAMRTIHLLHPKKRARFGGFKKRRRA